MSWDVCLEREGKAVPVERHSEGGTYVLGGRSEAELNITYNYATHLLEAGITLNPDDEGTIHNKRAGDTIELLENTVKHLGVQRADDYWKPTPGNAGYAISILLAWARQHPDAIWRVA